MSQVKKYQGGGLYDDVTSRQEANQIRRAANKAERMYRRGQRKAMRQYYNPTEARQARINKLADKIEQQQEIAGIKQGMDEYQDLSAYQDQIETNGPSQNPGDTYGGFMRRPGQDYTEQGGGDYFNTQKPHPGNNFIIWNGQKVLWNDFQREQMQKYLNTLDPEDRQFLAGVVDALNDGYDVEYDTNRMALNMPNQYYYVRGKNTVDRLKNEQSRAGAVLGGMFNTKMANYRDSIAQLSRYGLGLQDMDFSEITGLPGEDATTKAWGEGWEANPNYTKMMKRLDNIEGYLSNPETARQVYNELPDDKKWLLEETYKDPKFYEDLRKAMINGTLSSAQREFLKQIGIVSEGAKPAESTDGKEELKTEVKTEVKTETDPTITTTLQNLGITAGDGNAFYTHELLDDGTVQWNIGDTWNDKTKYAALNMYSGYEWGDTYSGGIMMNFNDKGWLVSNEALNKYLLNKDHIDEQGLFKFTTEDLNGIQNDRLRQEMTNLVNKYNSDTNFKQLVNDTIKQLKSDAELRRVQNQWTDYYTQNDEVTDKVEYLKPNSEDTFIGGLYNYGRTLTGKGGVRAITRGKDNENEYEAVEAITDMLRSNGTFQVPKKDANGNIEIGQDGKPIMMNATSVDWQDLSNFVEHGTDEVVMGFYDPNDIEAYDNMGFAIPNKARAIYKYNTKTRQVSKVDPKDVNMTGNFGSGKYNNMGFLTKTEGGKEEITSKRNGHVFRAVKKLQGTNNTLYIGVDTNSNDHTLWVWDNNLESPRRIFNTMLLQQVLNATTDEDLAMLARDPDKINIDSWTKGASGEIWENNLATVSFDPTLDWNQLTHEVTLENIEKWTTNIFPDWNVITGDKKKYNSDLYNLLKWYATESNLVAQKRHGGKLPKFQYGGAISSEGKEDIVTTQQDIVGVADPETFHKSINNFNKLSQSDKIALISTLGDVASTLGSLVPGLNLISAGVGFGSSVGHLVADIQRDGSDAKDWGNFAANVGLDLLSAIPIAGAAAKTTKAARGIKSISAIITPILMGLGAYSAAGAITKLMTDGWKSLSNEEVAQLAGGVSMLRNVLRGGRAAIDRAKVARDVNAGKSEVDLSKGIKLKSKTGQEVEITTSDGSKTFKLSELDISKDAAEQLSKAKDGIKRREIIEGEFKRKLGNDWDKLTQKEKNEFMSKFQSATEGVDISMPVTARQGGLRTKFSPNGQQAIVRIASPTDISAKKAFRQGLFNPSKVSLEKVGQHFTTKLGSDVSKLPSYMQRYIKNEFAKASTQPFIGVGSRYHGGNPENRLWIDRNWFTRNLFFPITRRAQGNLDNLPFTISYDKANWWKGWGPNKRYTLVDIPKPPKELLALPPHVSNISKPSNFKVEIPKVVEGNVYGYVQRPVQSPALPNTNTNTPQSKLLQRSSIANTAGQRNIFIKNTQSSIVDSNGNIKNDLKLSDLSDKIKNIKPKQLQNNGVLTKNTNGLTIEQIIKSYMKKYNGRVSESKIISIILNRYIRFGKFGMKIPKYQEAWGPIPTMENSHEKWLYGSPDSETLINGEEITDPNVNDLNNVTRAPGTELLPRQTETITRRKIKRKRDGASKGAFMENVNWGNLLDKEWLAKIANLIQNLGSARKLYENQKDAINEQAKYRIPNINERYTQFFDDGATSNFMQQAAASRNAISNMAGSDSRANMAMALANEQRIGQEQNNLNRHNALRYAEWQNTNNKEHAKYDEARYNTFLQNQRRDSGLSQALHQAKDNYINQKQQLWNNFGADVITRIQQEKSNKDNAYDANIWNRLNQQAIAAIKKEFPKYGTDDFKPTPEQQQRIQAILDEKDALYSAYSHNNRSVFNRMNINKPSWFDESSMNVFKSGGKLSEKDKERIKIDKETAKRFHDLLKLQIRENVRADKEYRKMLNQL